MGSDAHLQTKGKYWINQRKRRPLSTKQSASAQVQSNSNLWPIHSQMNNRQGNAELRGRKWKCKLNYDKHSHLRRQ